MRSTFADRLADREQGPVILDGGLASELERRGHDVSGSLWSARVLRDQPDAVRAVHAAYFAAGSEVATSASYQATYEGYAAAGTSAPETTRLLRRSVELADQARRDAAEQDEAAGRPVRRRWVAASVGPYGALLADGSEYRGDYGRTTDELRAFHRARLQVLAGACLDVGDAVLAVETIPSLREVEALVDEIAGLGVPAWVSVTPAGGRLRTGEPLEAAFAVATAAPELVALGVNCCDPADVDEGLAAAVATGRPALAYPNTGEAWDAGARVWTGRPTLDPEVAARWVDEGARALGGCCRVGPALLGEIAAAVGR
ncbi:MAG: homocysteine S-methyltransferase [Actinomycetales bacterium]